MPDESKMQAEVKRVAAKLRANSKPHHKAGTSQAESKKGMADEERRILAFADRVALAGIAIGLFGAIAALSFPLAYPDLIPVHSWRVVLLISLCILAIAIGFLIYEIVREIGTGRDKRTRKRLLIGLQLARSFLESLHGASGLKTKWTSGCLDLEATRSYAYLMTRIFEENTYSM